MTKRYGIKIVSTPAGGNQVFDDGERAVFVIGKREAVLEAHASHWPEVYPEAKNIFKNGYKNVVGVVRMLEKWKKYQGAFWVNDVSIVEYDV